MAWDLDYATLAEFKHFIKVPEDDTKDDVEFALALTAASRAVDRACLRQFGMSDTPEDRYYTAVYDRTLSATVIRIDDVTDATGLTVSYDSARDETYNAAVTPVRLLPRNAAAKGRAWEEIQVLPGALITPGTSAGAVKVHTKFGWAAVPKTVKQATLLQANRFSSRRDSPYGVTGSPDLGSELRLLAKVDPDVAVMLAGYRRKWGAV